MQKAVPLYERTGVLELQVPKGEFQNCKHPQPIQ